MKRKFLNACWVGLLLLCLTNCNPQGEPQADQIVEGYKPSYTTYEAITQVSSKEAQLLKNPGKIYVKGPTIFVNERNEGIHVVDNSNPAAPKLVSFIQIPGNVDIAVKENILYADNVTDLVAIDITDPLNITVTSRVKNAFPNYLYPPFKNVKFECADASKGIIVGWEKTQLKNPACFR